MSARTDGVVTPRWMTQWLRAAGVYNVVWGLLTLVYPGWLFDLTGLPRPEYPFIWQCVGMIVGVYGVGYWIAAGNPARHWPIVLVGLLGKLFGPIGYASGVVAGWLGLTGLPFVAAVPVEFGVTIPTNDLVWWVPFTLILLHALRVNTLGDVADATDVRTALGEARASDGRTLLAISEASPVLLVFLRHSGCTFCKEAVSDIAEKRAEIERAGASIALVHMSSQEDAERWLRGAGLDGVPHVSDPTRRLYRSFELRRGTVGELFGLRVWLRGMAATLRGHFVGRMDGDGFQMPGAFVVHRGVIVKAYRHADASDRPDYVGLSCGADGSACGEGGAGAPAAA